MSNEQEIKLAAQLGHDAYLVRVATVATLACLSYDYIITFENEWRFIWCRRRLSYFDVAFLLNRYVPFVAAAGFVNLLIAQDPNDISKCGTLFVIFGGATVLEYHIAEVILFMRAYYVWMDHKRAVLALICTFFAGITAVALYFAVQFLRATTIFNQTLYPHGCAILSPGHINKPPIIMLMLSETFALTLLLVQGRYWRDTMLGGRLIQDGIIYYVVAILSSIANLIVMSTTSEALCNMLLVTQAALHSICCNRLLLGIRGCSLSRTETVPSSPEHVDFPDFFYNMGTLSRMTKSITFAHSQNSSTSPVLTSSPTDFPPTPVLDPSPSSSSSSPSSAVPSPVTPN